MRYSLLLVAALTATLAACESSNTRYGLTGDENNTDSRAQEYSGAKDSATSEMDANRSWNNNKQLDEDPAAPSHSPDMPR